jgi:hypothetical protein
VGRSWGEVWGGERVVRPPRVAEFSEIITLNEKKKHYFLRSTTFYITETAGNSTIQA